jgi:ABC-type enterochelin transport system ATPase subunit
MNDLSQCSRPLIELDEGCVLDIGISDDMITKDILQKIFKTYVNLVKVDEKSVDLRSTNFRNGG